MILFLAELFANVKPFSFYIQISSGHFSIWNCIFVKYKFYLR